MIHLLKDNIMKLTCPECKNDVDLTSYLDLKENKIVECGMCGITLLVISISDDGEVSTEIVDEGK